MNIHIGIDFDNTIICYDEVFCELAKQWQIIDVDYVGNKNDLRQTIQQMPDGDLTWQRLQGKIYGEYINKAFLFPGFKEFICACNNARPSIKVSVVSHKTEYGHFDENKIKLREAARDWLRNQGFFKGNSPFILEENIFFETTREEKIERIKQLECTHFIDDLIEVLYAPQFPDHIKRLLFSSTKNFVSAVISAKESSVIPAEAASAGMTRNNEEMSGKLVKHETYGSWKEIKDAIFTH